MDLPAAVASSMPIGDKPGVGGLSKGVLRGWHGEAD